MAEKQLSNTENSQNKHLPKTPHEDALRSLRETHKKIKESKELPKTPLEGALRILKETHEKVKEIKEASKGSLHSETISEIEKTEKALETLIPSMGRIVSAVSDIRNEVLQPVTEAIKISSRESITEIKDSAQKSKWYNWISIVLASIRISSVIRKGKSNGSKQRLCA